MKIHLPIPTHQEVIDLVPCPKCDAPIGTECDNEMQQWRNKVPTKRNHQDRVRAARAKVHKKL